MTDVRREPSCSAKPADNKINGGMTQPVIKQRRDSRRFSVGDVRLVSDRKRRVDVISDPIEEGQFSSASRLDPSTTINVRLCFVMGQGVEASAGTYHGPVTLRCWTAGEFDGKRQR